MTRGMFAVAGAALGVLLLGPGAASAEPAPEDPERPLHLSTPFEVRTDGGTELRLPPGYYLTEEGWDRLDAEIRRLQERVTRAEAENASLRESLTPGWGWVAGTVGGFGAGVALTCWLVDDPPDICIVAGVGW